MSGRGRGKRVFEGNGLFNFIQENDQVVDQAQEDLQKSPIYK